MSFVWAVATINFFDNELKQTLEVAEDWKEALHSHSKRTDSDGGDANFQTFINELPPNMDEAKEEFFDADQMFECTLIGQVGNGEINNE